MPDVLDPKLDTVNDTPLAEDEELLEGVRSRSRVPGDLAEDAFAEADSGSAGLDFESAGLGNLNEDFSTLNRPNPQAGLSSLPKKLFPGELKKPRPKVPVTRSLGGLRKVRGMGNLAGKFKGGKGSLVNAVPGGEKLMGAADKLIETGVKRSAVGLAAGAFDKIAGTNVSKGVADITKAGVKGALEGGVAGAAKEIGQEVLTDPKKRRVIIFSAIGLVLFQAFAGVMVVSAVMIGLCSVPGFSTVSGAASGVSSVLGGPAFDYCSALNGAGLTLNNNDALASDGAYLCAGVSIPNDRATKIAAIKEAFNTGKFIPPNEGKQAVFNDLDGRFPAGSRASAPNDKTLSVLYMLATQTQYRGIKISALSGNTHAENVAGTNNISPHIDGRGIDISEVNGIRLFQEEQGPDTAANREVIKGFARFLVANVEANQYIGPQYIVDAAIGSFFFLGPGSRGGDHRDHIHITMPRIGEGTSITGIKNCISFTVNGHKLDAKRQRWVSYVAANVVSKLPGTREQNLQDAAIGTWWALKEGVFDESAPLAYSLCHDTATGNDRRLAPLEACTTSRIWQVGVAGVQVYNNSASAVLEATRQIYPSSSVSQVLTDTARSAGFEPSSAIGQGIVGSTGNLQSSWLLRNAAIGFYFVNREASTECVQDSRSWCYGSGWPATRDFAPDKASAMKSISDIKNILSTLSQ